MKKLIFASALLISLAGCSSLVDDLNQDPNNPTAASYQFILTGAEVGNIVLQTGETARKAGIFCGYYTGIDRQHLGFSEYAVTTSDFNSQWNNAYVDALVNARDAEQAATAEGIEGVTIGITQALQAIILGTTASLWGDIPYEEAGFPDIENPVFEDQVSVYGNLQTLLDQAIDNLAAGTGRPASNADIHLDGNPAAWTQIAQTLKARYYLHTKDYAAAYAAAQQGIAAPSNNLMAPHGTAVDNSNLNYQFFALEVRQSDLITSEFFASLITPSPDLNPDFGNYRGNAKTDETGRYNYLLQVREFGPQPNIEDGFAAQDASAPLVTYAENLLILAEAGFRSQGFATGLRHLNEYRAYLAGGGYFSNADPAQIRYEAYDAEDFDSGGIENLDGLSPDNALLREILEERYITFFGQVEGFNDTRRTEGETAVRVPVTPNTGSRLPQRFLYPNTEIDRNPNVPKPVPDFFDPTRVNQ